MITRNENSIRETIKLMFLAIFIALFTMSLASFFSLFHYSFPLFIFPFFFIFFFVIFEKPTHNEGYFIAIFTGFWTDLFSYFPFGFFTLCFFITTYTLKFLLQRYVNI